MRFRMCAVGLVVAGLAGSASAQVYVDVVGGFDFPGAGSFALPFKTITGCLSLIPSTPTQIILMPGSYNPYTGEVFPISLPDGVSIEAWLPGTVDVQTDIISSAISDCFQLPPGTTSATFKDLEIFGNGHAISATPMAGDNLNLTITNCTLRGGWGLIVAGLGGNATVDVADCKLKGVTAGARVRADGPGTVTASFRDCDFIGALSGVELGGYAGGNLQVSATTSLFRDHGTQGFRSTVDATGHTVVDVDHCVFASIGKQTAQPPIKDITGLGGIATWNLRSSIFFDCKDLAPSVGPTWTVDHCLFGAGAVPGTGNLVGDPSFVDAAHDDYHLMPGSLAIDAGGAGPVAKDRDGDPVPGHPSLTGVAVADIGLDEFYTHAFHFHPPVLALEDPSQLVATGTPGSLAILFVSAQSGNPNFGPAFQLTVPVATLVLGNVPPSGVLSVDIPPVLDVAFLGLEAFTQVAYAVPPHGLWSFDHHSVKFVP